MNKAQHYARRVSDHKVARAARRVESILLFLTGAAIGSAITNLLIIDEEQA